MNPNRVDFLIDLLYGVLLFLAILLLVTVGTQVGVAFGLGALIAYVIHVAWKMARFDPDWMTREIAASIEQQVAADIAEGVEREVAAEVADSVGEQVAEEVSETVERTLAEEAGADEQAGRGGTRQGEDAEPAGESSPGGGGAG